MAAKPETPMPESLALSEQAEKEDGAMTNWFLDPVSRWAARFVWRTTDRLGISLGRFAPVVFGVMIGAHGWTRQPAATPETTREVE